MNMIKLLYNHSGRMIVYIYKWGIKLATFGVTQKCPFPIFIGRCGWDSMFIIIVFGHVAFKILEGIFFKINWDYTLELYYYFSFLS